MHKSRVSLLENGEYHYIKAISNNILLCLFGFLSGDVTYCFFVPADMGAESSALQGSLSGDVAEKGEKPLKLVLKVGPQESTEAFSSQQTEERAKHKHKKKKKKKEGKEREREEVCLYTVCSFVENVTLVCFTSTYLYIYILHENFHVCADRFWT